MLFVIMGTLAAGAFVRLDAEAEDAASPLVADAAAFQVPAGGAVGVSSSPASTSSSPVMSATSRRAALAGGAAAAASLALPRVASADDSDDAIARIAAKANQANEDEKRRKLEKIKALAAKGRTEDDVAAKQKEEAKRNILTIAGGGTLASTAFFYKNLQRLFIKITSGGEDDGYDRVANQGKKQPAPRGRGKKAPEPEPEKKGFFR